MTTTNARNVTSHDIRRSWRRWTVGAERDGDRAKT
jgi:hypothetical protein